MHCAQTLLGSKQHAAGWTQQLNRAAPALPCLVLPHARACCTACPLQRQCASPFSFASPGHNGRNRCGRCAQGSGNPTHLQGWSPSRAPPSCRPPRLRPPHGSRAPPAAPAAPRQQHRKRRQQHRGLWLAAPCPAARAHPGYPQQAQRQPHQRPPLVPPQPQPPRPGRPPQQLWQHPRPRCQREAGPPLCCAMGVCCDCAGTRNVRR
jgi:hypothetical protein